MKKIGKIVSRLLLAANLLCVALMLFSAWSPWIVDPREHSLWALAGFLLPLFFFLNLAFAVMWVLFSWRYALLSLVAFACCQGQLRAYCPLNLREEEIPQQGVIKVLSYNVMGFDKLLKDGSENLNPILGYIKRQDADIVCLQEFRYSTNGDPAQLSEEDICSVLKEYPYYAHGGSRKSGRMNLAVFSRFPILSSSNVDYGESMNASMLHELLVGSDTLTLVNNHLESNKLTKADKALYEEIIKDPNKNTVSAGGRTLLRKLAEAGVIRAGQADLLAERMAREARPTTIICGDFNDIPVSYTHRVVQGDRRDAYVDAGSGPGISYNQNKFYFRIDNILYSGALRALRCRVDNSIKDSDHYPIYAYLSLENR